MSILLTIPTDARWLKSFKKLQGIDKQRNIIFTTKDVEEFGIRMSNWKAQGPNGMQGFWFKRINNLHQAIAKYLQASLASGKVHP